jgi:hypothetical protein
VALRKCYPTWRSRCHSGDWRKCHKWKYHQRNYREGMWVLGGVDRKTNQSSFIPCPNMNNQRGSDVRLPLIQNSRGGSSFGASFTRTNGPLRTIWHHF